MEELDKKYHPFYKDLRKKITIKKKKTYCPNTPTYPREDFIHIPIVNTKTQEVILFYIPEEEIENFNSLVNPLNSSEILEDKDIIQNLIKYFKQSIERNFNYGIEKRLDYAYKTMNEIQPSVSIVINMPEEFKDRPVINFYLQMFRDIRKNVKENLNTYTIFTNPFDSNKEENSYRNLRKSSDKKILKKWGLSFGTLEELLQKEKEDELKYLNEAESSEEINFSYKNVLEEILIKRHQDFRKEIFTECILNDQNFDEDDFEKFILYLEFFIESFTGLQCKYFIDELGFLNMDFYANEQNLMTLAEIIHYKLQFKIMNKAVKLHYKNLKGKNSNKATKINDVVLKIKENEEVDEDKSCKSDLKEPLLKNFSLSNKRNLNIIDEELEKMNNTNYELLNFEDVSLFPPYADFTKKTAHYFRRYDKSNNYHLCPECKNLKISEDTFDLSCSSLFRNIDKTRIIYSAINNVIDTSIIKDPKNPNIKALFKFILIIHNYEELEKLTRYIELVKEYTWPAETQKVTKINNEIRNTFGEDFGFYFFWVTHYINWLLFPGLLGLFLYLIEVMIFIVEDSVIDLYINLVFAGVVMLWANFYINSWKSKEKFLRTIWGMEDFKVDRSNQVKEVRVDRWVFMGLTIPVMDKFDYYLKRIFSAIVIFLCLCVTMATNLFLFYLENSQINVDIDIPFAQNEISQITNGYWLYIIPVVTFMLREYMSRTYRRIAIFLTNKECHFHRDDYKSSMKMKTILFEFFNYYFNLYYIAFIKRYLESCPMNNCYNMLSGQLTGILTTSIILDIIKVFWFAVYKRKKQKSFETNIKEKNPNVNNKSSKYIYYTRAEYESTDASGEILDIVMNYGYIIQFGACSPVSFFIALLQTIVMRFTDALAVGRIKYVRLISESLGIGVFHRVLKFMTFLGLITNISLIFFTDDLIVPGFSLTQKFLFLILIENVVLVVVMFWRSKNQPLWFRYKDRIEITYLKKYSYNAGDSNIYYETSEDQESEIKRSKARLYNINNSPEFYDQGKEKIE